MKQDEPIIIYVDGTTEVIDSNDIYEPFPEDGTDEEE